MAAAEEEVREVMTAESGTLAVLHSSEIDTQITTARKYPRSIKRSRDELMELVTLTEDVARECVYALPRKQDGKRVMIEGPSARFAEILAHSWGNARAGARVIDDHGDFVTAQGVFHDLEKNVAITYEVKRRIINKDGHRFSTDMIGTASNAACSIALRNAVLKGVPKALWSDAYEAVRKVIMGDAKTLATRRANALATMLKFGLDAEQACQVLGVAGVDDIGLEELAALHGICGTLRDGETTIERLLEQASEEAPTRVSAVSERIRKPKESPQEPPKLDPDALANLTEFAQAQAAGEANKPTANESAFADRHIMIQDAMNAEQLNYIQQLPDSAFTVNQIKLLDAAIAKKRASFAPPVTNKK